MLQVQVLTMPGHSLRLPTRFTAIRIDPRVQNERAFDLSDSEKGTVDNNSFPLFLLRHFFYSVY